MRDVSCDKITDLVAELCIKANIFISKDIREAMEKALLTEESKEGRVVLTDLLANIKLAGEKGVAACQDTGMAVVFVEIGQEVHITEGLLADAVNKGVAKGYKEGYLRASVVKDPLIRENTRNNTPAIIHYDIVEGVKNFILDTVIKAGPNPCPPIIIGVGIGGTIEKAATIAKTALLRSVGSHHPQEHIASLEKELLERINRLGIGPGGLGGRTTALALNINVYPTHIAGLPVVVNMGCHATRHASGTL